MDYGVAKRKAIEVILAYRKLYLFTDAQAMELGIWLENPPADLNWATLKLKLVENGLPESETQNLYVELRGMYARGVIGSEWIRLNGNGGSHETAPTTERTRRVRSVESTNSLLLRNEGSDEVSESTVPEHSWRTVFAVFLRRIHFGRILLGFLAVIVVAIVGVKAAAKLAQLSADAPMIVLVILALCILVLVTYAGVCYGRSRMHAADVFIKRRRVTRMKVALGAALIAAVLLLLLVQRNPNEARKLVYMAKADFMVLTHQNDYFDDAALQQAQTVSQQAEADRKQAEDAKAKAEADQQRLKLAVGEANESISQVLSNLAQAEEYRKQENELSKQIEALRAQAITMGILGSDALHKSQTALTQEQQALEAKKQELSQLQALLDRAKQPSAQAKLEPAVLPSQSIVSLSAALADQAATAKHLADENTKLKARLARQKKLLAEARLKTKTTSRRTTTPSRVVISALPSKELKVVLKKGG